MSYILEALKKAQAERQIGNAPTIHAPTLASAPAGQGGHGKRTPVIVAMVLMATAIVGLAMMLLRQPQAASPQPSAALPPAAGSAPAAVQSATAPPSATAPASAAPVVPAQEVAAPALAAQVSAPAQGTHPSREATQPPTPQTSAATSSVQPRRRDASAATADLAVSAPPPAAPQATAPVPAPVPAPVEEQVQSMRDLPEPIQRAIPQITLGGYMYSKNPADRLLLIDKVLRREGEEVAPGLVLEKLQPKQAIFGFRGYRYRVAL